MSLLEHLDQDIDRAVGHCRHVPEPVLELENVFALHLRYAKIRQRRHNVLAHHLAVVTHRVGFAVHRDVLAEITRGEIAHGGRGLGFRLDKRFTGLDANDELHGRLAGLLGRDVAVAADGRAPGPAAEAGLDDVHFTPRWINANPEAGQVPVPHHGILVVDCEAVHDALGELVIMALGHIVLD